MTSDKNFDQTKFKKTYTVGDLKRELKIFNDDMEIYFEGFNFERLKKRGDKILQIEISVKEYED